MSANWASVNAANYLSYPAGDFAGTGAYTMALLVDMAGNDCRLMDWFNSSTEKGQFLFDTGSLFGGSDFSGVATGITGSTAPYTLFAITKQAGAQVYRMHYWTYDQTGAGTMTHANSGAATHANESPAATTCRVGWSSGTSMNGSIAVAAWWDFALPDASLDTLKSPNLDTWAALSPDLGVHFGSWTGSAGTDVVWAGNSAQATLNGTVGSGSNPTSFNFTLTAPVPKFELLTPTPRYY